MAESQSTQPELFHVAELPGRPMLHWHGKRPLREIPYYLSVSSAHQWPQ